MLTVYRNLPYYILSFYDLRLLFNFSLSSITSPLIQRITVCMTHLLTSKSSWILNSRLIWRLRSSGAVLHSYWLRHLSCQSTAQITLLRWIKAYPTCRKNIKVSSRRKEFRSVSLFCSLDFVAKCTVKLLATAALTQQQILFQREFCIYPRIW